MRNSIPNEPMTLTPEQRQHIAGEAQKLVLNAKREARQQARGRGIDLDRLKKWEEAAKLPIPLNPLKGLPTRRKRLPK